MRVVIDTNLIINRVIANTGAAAEILRFWRRGRFELLVTIPILQEYRRALAYPRVRARHGHDDRTLDALVATFANFGTLIEPAEVVEAVSADPGDDKFITCAVAGQAEYLVTRDAHLLAIQTFRGTTILPPGEFLTLLQADE